MAADPATTEVIAAADMTYPSYTWAGIEARSNHNQSVYVRLGKRRKLGARNARGRPD